ncbi:hypothetical protein Fmac_033067 [Flemingia macrophylla]|uniref:Uncharacterized protein n=1 Tax=Flemingia macrophylla TaxID=520843 RepID=A0ABD1L6Q9_9FABA
MAMKVINMKFTQKAVNKAIKGTMIKERNLRNELFIQSLTVGDALWQSPHSTNFSLSLKNSTRGTSDAFA